MDKFVIKSVTAKSVTPNPKQSRSKVAVNMTAKARANQYEPGKFHVDNGLLFCSKCNVVVDHARKSTVDDHLKSKRHEKVVQVGKQATLETTLKCSTSAKAEKVQVCHEWIRACTAASIPLLKSDSPSVREFLKTRVKNVGAIPGSSQLRNEYLFDV